MSMNERQRILKLLNGETPDRVPWFGDLSYWIGSLMARGQFSNHPDAYLDFHRKLRVGFYLQGYFPFHTDYDSTVEIECKSENNASVRSFRTPKGTLREETVYLPESYTSATTEHLVKSAEDLPVVRYLYEHMSFRPNYDTETQRSSILKADGIVLRYAPKTPFMQLAALDAGIEAIVGIIMDAEDEFAETLKVMESRLDEAVEIAAMSPSECIMIPENLSSEVVGKSFFEKYMRECQEKWLDRIHKEGKYSFIHIDGSLAGLLKEEGSVGFTVLEALTPSPVGDVPVGKWREIAGGKSVLWGGLPGIYFTPLVSDQEFDRHVREVLEVMRQDPSYVLGVADQVPPDGLEQRVRRVAELADQYGKY